MHLYVHHNNINNYLANNVLQTAFACKCKLSSKLVPQRCHFKAALDISDFNRILCSINKDKSAGKKAHLDFNEFIKTRCGKQHECAVHIVAFDVAI